nr:MAG TPA: hypothetical protein [Caudoviricetes sp.]
MAFLTLFDTDFSKSTPAPKNIKILIDKSQLDC